MKTTLVFFLFCTGCFSQGQAFTVPQIDSIAQINGSYGNRDKTIKSTKNIVTQLKSSNGKIYEEKEVELQGKGSSSTSTYLNYFNQEYYNALTDLEKRMYYREKDSELIKAVYHHNLTYEDSGYDRIIVHFYYHNKALFYLKINYVTKESSGKEKTTDFALKSSELQDGKQIKNTLLADLKPLLNSINKEILEQE